MERLLLLYLACIMCKYKTAFVFFAKFIIIAKYLKQEVDDNLSVCVD